MENMLISSVDVRIQTTSDGYVDMANGSSASYSSSYSVLRERIKFHPARKQFNGFSTNGDFRIETLNPDSGRKRPYCLDASQSGKKVDGSEFVENSLDPELSFGITVRRIGAGLENLGNTCFLNSVLQCLTYTEPLAAYLQSGKHQNSCHVAGFCALCAIQKHVSRALQSTGRSLVPKDLVSNLRCISRNFRNARQEDAHEYMVNLLESMHKCCLPSGVPSESPAAYEKSLVHKIFGGLLRSQVECQQCSYCSNKFDPFLDLSLEIVKADSLPVALRNFTAAELLDGGEKQYQCQRCKQKVRAKKRFTVHKAPYVLAFHLKRFHAHDPGRKVDKKVLFDRSLDMKPFVSGSYEGDLKYSLYGVLVHFGHNTRSGHYVCYVRTSSGMWYLLNDNKVCQVSEKNVLEQKAYMLFYVRDRKNIAPKKPVNVSQKEKAKAIVSGNLANLVSKQFSKDRANNDLMVNRSNSTDITANKQKKDAPKVGVSKETLLMEATVQKNNRLIMAECSVPLERYCNEPFLKGTLKGVSSLNPELGGSLLFSDRSAKRNAGTPALENSTITTVAKTSCITEGSPISNGPQILGTDQIVSNATSQKIDLVLDVGVPKKVVSGDSSEKTVEKIHELVSFVDSHEKTLHGLDFVKSPKKSSRESGQGGGVSGKNAAGNSPNDRAGDGGQRIEHEFNELSNILIMPSKSLIGKGADCASQKKFKKKLPKFSIPSMHLGSMFFRASLGVRKRKKHKKGKRCTLDTQNLIKEQLLDSNCFSSEHWPSTSKKCIGISSGLINSQVKGAKTGSKKPESVRKDVGDSIMDIIDGEFRERNKQSGAVLATDRVTQKSSSSIAEANQRDGELDCGENTHNKITNGRDPSHNKMTSIFTRGLEQTAVARWNEIELPPSDIVESTGTEVRSIGYVPDEWDEEYDRGKKKKIRSFKHKFGGPNPFQEIATRKSQFKKSKMDQSSSGNRPFRI